MVTGQDGVSLSTPTPIHLSRDQIMQATGRCLREAGYDATTIRRIAGLLDCAVGSIYRYFIDKRELLFAVTQQMLEPVAQRLDAGATVEESTLAYYRCALTDPAGYQLMFWLASVGAGLGKKGAAGGAAGNRAGAPPGMGAAPAGVGGGAEGHLLPPVVARIMQGWTAALGDPARTRRHWTILHGAIMLGQTAPEVFEALKLALPAEPERPAEAPVVRRLTFPPITPVEVRVDDAPAGAAPQPEPAKTAPPRPGDHPAPAASAVSALTPRPGDLDPAGRPATSGGATPHRSNDVFMP